MPQNYGLLEKKQAEWRNDIDIMLGRRVADTTHHHEFPSTFRTSVRQPPPPPPSAACLRPRPRYSTAEKILPCGEAELCILCTSDPSSEDIQQDKLHVLPCVDGLVAL